jgi:transposase
MNLGINGLSKIVSNELKRPLLNGDVFIFFGKNRQMVKLLCWDGDGFLLYQKRLEEGTFELPRFRPGQKAAEMPYRTLSAIMRGVSLRSVRYRKRLRIGESAYLQPPDYQ